MKSMCQHIVIWGGYVVYRINDQVAAGTLFCVCGNQMYLFVIAHDDSYRKYNLGNLVLLKTIERAIECNISEFHFLWGRCDYKARFKSEQMNLYKIEIYKFGYSFLLAWIINELIKIYEKTKEKVKSFLMPIYKKIKGIK